MREIKKIVIHHSACPDSERLDIEKIKKWHKERGFSDIGYHFVIEKIGNEPVAIVTRPLHFVGAHCKGHNFDSIGICFVGNFNEKEPDEDLIEHGIRYVVSPLIILFKLCVEDIYGHRELADTDCPGKKFDLNEFKKRVLKIMKGG